MKDLDLFAEPPPPPEPKLCGTCGAYEPGFVGGTFCALSCLTIKETDKACDWHYPRVDKPGARA